MRQMIEEWTAQELAEQKEINMSDPEYIKWQESGAEIQEDEEA